MRASARAGDQMRAVTSEASPEHSGPLSLAFESLCLTFKRQLFILTWVGILLEFRACVPCLSTPRVWTVIICTHDNLCPPFRNASLYHLVF